MRSQSPFSPEMIESILEGLPLDITIIDRDDRVIAWTTRDRGLFNIEDEVMGTDIRNCHSPKSIDVLENLLNEMKEGRLDSTRTVNYVEKNGSKRRFMTHYIALRDGNGEYLGCMEVDTDISDIPEADDEGESY